jgi:hypothetical protein
MSWRTDFTKVHALQLRSEARIPHCAAGIEVKLHPLCLDVCCWLFVALFGRKEREYQERGREKETDGGWVVVAGEIEERSGLVVAGWEETERRKIGRKEREKRYWKLGQPIGVMAQQIAAHLTFYSFPLFFLFSSFYFLYKFIGCVLLS